MESLSTNMYRTLEKIEGQLDAEVGWCESVLGCGSRGDDCQRKGRGGWVKGSGK